jgi:hypothetical protein
MPDSVGEPAKKREIPRLALRSRIAGLIFYLSSMDTDFMD